LLFNLGIIKSRSFQRPVILVGNLTTGGTGKTPHVECILQILKSEKIPCAMLSRGYGRLSDGFQWVQATDEYFKTGDEPLQIKQKFSDVPIAVDGNRIRGLTRIWQEQPAVKAVVMDDGFQHRKVKPSLSILLMDYEELNKKNYLLPAGTLREPLSSASRADIIIVTKTPAFFTPIEKRLIKDRMKCYTSQQVFFTTMQNSELLSIVELGKPALFNKEYYKERKYHVLLVTGIANPHPLEEYIKEHFILAQHLRFADHHRYSAGDIQKIKDTFAQIPDDKKIIITTEKDAMRLNTENLRSLYNDLPLFYMRVDVKFHQKDYELFKEIIVKHVAKFR
jgi:tetraacyldisaccharide 4'-kinase